MKKFIAIMLVLAAVLGMCACSGSSDDNSAVEGLQVGWGRVNITPNFLVGIAGYSDQETRKSTDGIVDYLYTTCLAFRENDETVLLFTIDNLAAAATVVEKMRQKITEVLPDIPAENIFVSATHSHSAPSLTDSTDEAKKYQDTMFYPACIEAAQTAVEDLSATTIYAGATIVENMTFVRHYEMTDGTYAGSNFGDFSKTIVGHATDSDDEMQLVKFDRADEEKQDILLVNWQTHPDRATEIGYNSISASLAGTTRTKIEKDTELLCAYFTGAAGNQNPDTQIASEKNFLNFKEYGDALGQAAIDALSGLTVVEGSGIKTATVDFEVEVDHSWDHMLEQAEEVYNLWKSTDRATGDALGKTYDFSSVYQARAIRTRAGMDLTASKELNVFSVGGIGFVNGDYEMFSDAGLYIKDKSEYDITIIAEGCHGYIPSAEAYDYRSYEADTGYYAKGTAEKLAEQFVTMLNGLND